MNQRLSHADTIGLGLMTFAFFLGAGNIIFPPLEGQLAGTNVLYAMFGFLLTAVGLPLVSIIAVARVGGGLPSMTTDLPKGTGTFAAVLLFIIIGPAFATPRTGLVAYEMAIKPLIGTLEDNQLTLSADIILDKTQAIITSLFFVATLFFSWSRGKLIDNIGKILTPALFLLLICLAIGVIVAPQGTLSTPAASYQDNAFTKGFIGGYNTMDTFAALMFGMLLVDILRSKGVTEPKSTYKYLVIAGLIAAAGLAFVYISLFWLGATSSTVAPGAENGGVVLAAYVQALFGQPGQWILSGVVLLACLTTAVGLVSACADYFSTLTPLRYRQWVVVLCIICALVANVGLSQLIALSVPVLLALYPLTIALVALTFIRPWLPNPKYAFRTVMFVALIFSLLDGMRGIAGLQNVGWIKSLLDSQTEYMPLAAQGMAWVLPTAIVMLLVFLIPGNKTKTIS
ncbi:branched-chain amino acid transport system II carrier protein [Budviciaceae bacterium BWR-B9]|uniref:Branched-chain amino acid transport system carrier protein n=1 Tax=Limnobaculum allomyrinae TaxID=2791986 RepID=A0ABS1IU83_9GAMM|nr:MULTISPECIES: branched-chain amino acid transport system II carrier protein [Limnobaculum]MBK5145338.1 branched-chain amino acid transport system II carrier protein [Limnobaculum allomyrinae]MBV7693234.1 branched-chain amino acid transport system II carrier protein [Limnobaculum sp. M2-1]